ncbi:hypothetical protein [Solitalea lacus]|uniref:hypothetical protein n=1 Tax=Solitalea lacus TaxID=2911172 RepID=UPI001ED9D652|nr:hypothetical protein [Solitalea lacus]UKJ06506.1 hypothetical protein L2B55_13295 [Solitalea lacus]
MNALIKLGFKHLFTIKSSTVFEQNVFQDSYNELLMQAQAFDVENRYTNWQQLAKAIPKAAQTLPYKAGFAIGLYIHKLNRIVPNFTDNIGNPLLFNEHKFEIIQSDFKDKSKHVVALTYITDTLILIDSFGEYLILAYKEQSTDNTLKSTFTIKMQPGISVVSYQ